MLLTARQQFLEACSSKNSANSINWAILVYPSVVEPQAYIGILYRLLQILDIHNADSKENIDWEIATKEENAQAIPSEEDS